MRFAAFVLVLVGTAASAGAAPVSYTVSFAGSGILPTSGSFIYDAAVPVFTNFIVNWNGITFDMTGSANAPFAVGGCLGGPAGGFALMSGGAGCNGSPRWSAFSGAGAQLSFVQGDGNPQSRGISTILVAPQAGGSGLGTFTIQAVPEPSTMAMLIGSGAMLAWRRRRNSSR